MRYANNLLKNPATKPLSGTTCRMYIQLPPEEQTGSEQVCGLLEKSMYGTQDAPAIWQAHYTALLESYGFMRGKSNASVFYTEKDGARVLVHGDDFLALADNQGLESIDSMLRSAYELKRLGTQEMRKEMIRKHTF